MRHECLQEIPNAIPRQHTHTLCNKDAKLFIFFQSTLPFTLMIVGMGWAKIENVRSEKKNVIKLSATKTATKTREKWQ